jgi:hypothetical protein
MTQATVGLNPGYETNNSVVMSILMDRSVDFNKDNVLSWR